MRVWLLVAIALLLLAFGMTREHYVDVLDDKGRTIGGPGTRPSLQDAAWRSKIEVEAPIGGNTSDYETALRSFFDNVYKPLRDLNPTALVPAAQVEAFLNSQPATIDKKVLRRIILAGFAVDRGESAASREEKQTVTTGALKGFATKGGSQAIEPKDGVDETWPQYTNKPQYRPADSREGHLSEGVYKPTDQQETPRREGSYDDKSTSWTDTKYYGFCTDESCKHNVL
jgi:hypothetical protein